MYEKSYERFLNHVSMLQNPSDGTGGAGLDENSTEYHEKKERSSCGEVVGCIVEYYII